MKVSKNQFDIIRNEAVKKEKTPPKISFSSMLKSTKKEDLDDIDVMNIRTFELTPLAMGKKYGKPAMSKVHYSPFLDVNPHVSYSESDTESVSDINEQDDVQYEETKKPNSYLYPQDEEEEERMMGKSNKDADIFDLLKRSTSSEGIRMIEYSDDESDDTYEDNKQREDDFNQMGIRPRVCNVDYEMTFQ